MQRRTNAVTHSLAASRCAGAGLDLCPALILHARASAGLRSRLRCTLCIGVFLALQFSRRLVTRRPRLSCRRLFRSRRLGYTAATGLARLPGLQTTAGAREERPIATAAIVVIDRWIECSSCSAAGRC